MKATCIVGSARNNGSSSYIADTFIKGFKEANIQTIKYCISDCNIEYCKGCKNCYINDECIINDAVPQIINDIITSDYVVIIAPSYWAGIPAQLKAFFDRTTPYGDTNPNRKIYSQQAINGIAVAVRAGTREAENQLILDSIEHYFGHLNIYTSKRISICETDTLDDLLSKHQRTIDEIYLFAKNIKKMQANEHN